MFDRSGQQLEHYHLIRLLGEGGFGQVYLAENIYRKTKVAVKILKVQLSIEEFHIFLNEARVVRLKHPHIIPVLDFGVERKTATPFIVMDYAPNGTLRQRHRRGERVHASVVVQYVKELSEALQYAHEENLIHRDVKPENMLVGQQQDILLSDFGIAIPSQSGRISMQLSQEIKGTYYYMAPEQFHGKPSRASDQYALGIVAYEWLNGDCPFNGTFYEVLGQHMHVLPPSLRERGVAISPMMEQVVMRALAKDARQRFACVRDFALALEQSFKKEENTKREYGDEARGGKEDIRKEELGRRIRENAYQEEKEDTFKRTWVTRQTPYVSRKSSKQWIEEGNSHSSAGRYEEAIGAYSQAINLEPRNIGAYFQRGCAYHQLGLYQRAASEFDQVIALDPVNARAYYRKGLAYYKLRLYQRAISNFDLTIALNPNDVEAYDKCGSAYFHLEQYPRAINEFDQALALDPRNVTVYYKRGFASLQIGLYQQAVNDFDRVIALDPKDAWAYYNRGSAYDQLGYYERARSDYDQALALEPKLIQRDRWD